MCTESVQERDFARGCRTRGRGRISTLALAVLVVTLSAGCASNPGYERRFAEPKLTELDASRTQLEVNRFLGQTPDRCSPSRPDHELCVYVLGKFNRIWKLYAKSLHTRYKVNVLCEFESGRGQHGPGSCTTYVREADDFKPSKADLAAVGVGPHEDPRQRIANDLLAARRTIMEISDFVGDAPIVCTKDAGTLYNCLWRAADDAKGYKILASIAKTRRQVLLKCSIPRDGSARADGSCEVTEA